MKKVIVLILSGLFLYGCGSTGSTTGGTTTTSSGSDVNTTSPPAAHAGVTLTLVNAGKTTAKTVAGAGTPAKVRVVVRHYNDVVTQGWGPTGQLDSEGFPIQGPMPVHTYTLDFKDIQTFDYNNTITLGIPIGTFQLDIITSMTEGSNNVIVGYGYANSVTITALGPNNVTIPMNDVGSLLQMTVPDTVTSNGTFSVSFNQLPIFSTSSKMTMNFDGLTYTDSLHSAAYAPVVKYLSGTSATFTAPYSYDPGRKVSMQGEFTIDPVFLRDSEVPGNWKRVYPRSDFGEKVYSDLNQFIGIAVPMI